MIESAVDLWYALPAAAQDAALAAALLAPAALGLALAGTGLATGPPARALVRGHPGTAAAFVALIALSVGIAIAVSVQERGLRQGTARAADPFDVIVTAPGSEITAMLATVYLQSAPLPLVEAARWRAVAEHPATRLAAPLAFGDSVAGHPLVGTTGELVAHLLGRTAPGRAVDGRLFARADEAVAGAATRFAVGETVVPAHGVGFVESEHAGTTLEIVGRLPVTGTPWDGAVVAPIETTWLVHGLGDGHGGEAARGRRRLGPPFDPTSMPGVPAIVALVGSYPDAYALRGEFGDGTTMAFFPGEVLARLHAVLGDVRRAMSTLALATQILVAIAVLLALAILVRGFARRFDMLHALGAPRRYVFAVVWRYAVTLLALGTALGLGVGAALAAALARALGARTGVDMTAGLAASDAVPVAGFALVAVALAAVPAAVAARRGGRERR